MDFESQNLFINSTELRPTTDPPQRPNSVQSTRPIRSYGTSKQISAWTLLVQREAQQRVGVPSIDLTQVDHLYPRVVVLSRSGFRVPEKFQECHNTNDYKVTGSF